MVRSLVVSHFDLKMRFAPQQRATFRHLNLKNCPEAGVLCTFWLKTCFAPQLIPFLDIGTSKTAPKLRCFVHVDLQMYFAPQRRAICHVSAEQLPPHPPLYRAYFSNITRNDESLKKNTAIRGFPNIWRVCIFFLVTLLASWSSFFWLDFSSLLFNCPYCRKLDF